VKSCRCITVEKRAQPRWGAALRAAPQPKAALSTAAKAERPFQGAEACSAALLGAAWGAFPTSLRNEGFLHKRRPRRIPDAVRERSTRDMWARLPCSASCADTWDRGPARHSCS
jgi:hypothetical protein